MKTILSLCDFSGEWPRPYREAGYDVIQIDLKLGSNVFDLEPESLPEIHGILMAPPCTDFSVSGAQYWRAKDADGRTQASLAIVTACLIIKDTVKPQWWAMENPVGRLPKLLPNLLGKPVMYFNPCDYGDPYTKKTCLWGEFNTNLPKTPVEPQRVCSQGSWIQKLGGKSERTKELRSVTPSGFARAFFSANP